MFRKHFERILSTKSSVSEWDKVEIRSLMNGSRVGRVRNPGLDVGRVVARMIRTHNSRQEAALLADREDGELRVRFGGIVVQKKRSGGGKIR